MAAKKKVAKKKVAKIEAAPERAAAKKVTAKRPATKTKGECFVLMPFKSPFSEYYKLIFEPAVTKAGLKPKTADSIFRPSPIMDDVWGMIQKAEVLLAELTGKNANVFYELGLGHALGKPVVLVSETMDDVPFDLQQLRVITYDEDVPDWGTVLCGDITRALKAVQEKPTEAVPPMFRKKVKSQAPEESELSLRLSRLEQAARFTGQRSRSSSKPSDVIDFIETVALQALNPGLACNIIRSQGFSDDVVAGACYVLSKGTTNKLYEYLCRA